MGRLIDADKLIEYLLTPPWNIGWDDEIEIINNQPTVEAIPKDDVVTMLTELQLDIEKHTITSGITNQGTWNECISCCSRIIQQRINSLKENSDVC